MIDWHPADTALADHRVAASAINWDRCWIDTTLGMTSIPTVAIRRSATGDRAALANGRASEATKAACTRGMSTCPRA